MIKFSYSPFDMDTEIQIVQYVRDIINIFMQGGDIEVGKEKLETLNDLFFQYHLISKDTHDDQERKMKVLFLGDSNPAWKKVIKWSNPSFNEVFNIFHPQQYKSTTHTYSNAFKEILDLVQKGTRDSFNTASMLWSELGYKLKTQKNFVAQVSDILNDLKDGNIDSQSGYEMLSMLISEEPGMHGKYITKYNTKLLMSGLKALRNEIVKFTGWGVKDVSQKLAIQDPLEELSDEQKEYINDYQEYIFNALKETIKKVAPELSKDETGLDMYSKQIYYRFISPWAMGSGHGEDGDDFKVSLSTIIVEVVREWWKRQHTSGTHMKSMDRGTSSKSGETGSVGDNMSQTKMLDTHKEDVTIDPMEGIYKELKTSPLLPEDDVDKVYSKLRNIVHNYSELSELAYNESRKQEVFGEVLEGIRKDGKAIDEDTVRDILEEFYAYAR